MLNFEENFYFDQDLREIPKDPKKLLKRIDLIQKEMVDDEKTEDRVRHLGELGYLCRTLNELELAEQYLGQAMNLIEEDDLGPRFFVIYGIRLAHVWQWQKRFEESNPMFTDLINLCQEHSSCADLLDFAHQHAGKNLFDQKDYDGAIELFEMALTVRRQKDDKNLIDSTNLAIRTTKNHLQARLRGTTC